MNRLYANENFPKPVVDYLRGMGHDVQTTTDAGKSGQAISDVDVLKYAIEHRRAVITLNRRHFVVLHQSHPEHKGIIVCSLDVNFEAFGKRVHDQLLLLSSLQNVLIRINRPG